MNRINVLTKELSGRIAAGEVVQNPASVVKELVENSIDAGATAITIEIKNGGRDYIRVTDNGGGIHPDDVLLAVKKHATSKISSFEDIRSISSLGFRGEALSSIAAVSHLSIKTRMPQNPEGAELFYDASGTPVVKPAGLPDGTSVIVENIFYNIPGRFKFLKKPGQESAVISDLVSRLILSRPDISFKFINNDKTIYNSSGSGELFDAIMCVYDRTFANRIKRIEYNNDNISINGYISVPAFNFRSLKYQSIFVNERYVKSKNISGTINLAYGERILKGHYPFAVIDIKLPFDMVDVNVHPNKTSVLIYNEESILESLYNVIKSSFDETFVPAIVFPEIKIKSETKNETALKNIADKTQNNQIPENNDTKNDIFNYKTDKKSDFFIEKNEIMQKSDDFFNESGKTSKGTIKINETEFINGFDSFIKKEQKPQEQSEFVSKLTDFTDYKIIGSIFDTYLIIESEGKVFFIDQHAAHERMNYERLKNSEKISSQIFLIPQILTLNQADFDVIMDNIELLYELGFDIEEFGTLSIKISAAPIKTNGGELGKLIDEIIFEITQNKNDILILRDKIIKKACKMSIKAGDFLSEAEIKELISELKNSDIIPNCPHGRPIAIVMTKQEIEKGFKRRV